MNCANLSELHFDCVLEQRVAFLQRTRCTNPPVSFSKELNETKFNSPLQQPDFITQLHQEISRQNLLIRQQEELIKKLRSFKETIPYQTFIQHPRQQGDQTSLSQLNDDLLYQSSFILVVNDHNTFHKVQISPSQLGIKKITSSTQVADLVRVIFIHFKIVKKYKSEPYQVYRKISNGIKVEVDYKSKLLDLLMIKGLEEIYIHMGERKCNPTLNNILEKGKTIPKLSQLKHMCLNQLRKVKGFSYENKFGRVEFLKPVNLINVVIDEVITIKQDYFSLYENQEFKPIKGAGLNLPCQVTFYNFAAHLKLSEHELHNYVTDWSVRRSMRVVSFIDGKLVVLKN